MCVCDVYMYHICVSVCAAGDVRVVRVFVCGCACVCAYMCVIVGAVCMCVCEF